MRYNEQQNAGMTQTHLQTSPVYQNNIPLHQNQTQTQDVYQVGSNPQPQFRTVMIDGQEMIEM